MAETLERPWLLKALSIGTMRDVEVMDQLVRAFPKTLGDVWKEWDPEEEKTGQGYNCSPKRKQNPKTFLANLSVFERPESGFGLDYSKFVTFQEKHGTKTAHMPRREALYEPPLVIIPKSPGEVRKASKAYRATKTLAFLPD